MKNDYTASSGNSKNIYNYFSFERNMFTSDNTIAAMSAVPNPVTVSPGTIALMIIRRIALITNVNNPNEIIFIGSVRIRRIGFSNILNIPHTIDATRSDCQPLMVNPGTMYAVT
jgi:hypothetical protein